MKCQTCRDTGRVYGGARCPYCNPRPTVKVLNAQRELNGAGARYPDRSAVRQALENKP